MRVGVPREIHAGESRVAQTPQTVQRLIDLGYAVAVESGAGEKAGFADQEYVEAGCELVENARQIWGECDIVAKVGPPEQHPELGQHEADLLREGGTLIGFVWPAQNKELLDRLQSRSATVLAIDQVPRITRAQKMDALSSMANIAGYRAVVEAAQHYGAFFTGQMTAAGSVPPAKVLVIGAGVAGLAAIGAANGLGAVVTAFDTRPEVREQIESLGAKFVTIDIEEEGAGAGGYAKQMSDRFLEAERKLFEELAVETDIIITTALIPGKQAPLLVSEQALMNMKSGSVVVDLAAAQGGNCEGVQEGQVVVRHDVKLIGYTDLPSRMPRVSSTLYGNNLGHFIDELGSADTYSIDESNEVIRGALVLRQGELKWPPPVLPQPTVPKAASAVAQSAAADENAAAPSRASSSKSGMQIGMLIAAVIGLVLIGTWGDSDFLAHFTVFVLACFVGYQLIWNVTPALHTPLMSVTNAISGIIVVGGVLQISGNFSAPATILGAVAILVAMINVAGGFLVTQRMLKMFQKRK